MIGVIADDLSGAAELGGLGWRRGLRTEIVSEAAPSPDADLVCVDTDSRSLHAAEAALRVQDAAARLRSMGVDWIYKKVDSVLRGNVVAEVSALLASLDRRKALIIPANPGRGRVVREGRYLIHDRPIDETPFAHDPEHPRRTSSVIGLLDMERDPAVRVCRPEVSEVPDGIVVGEAASSDELRGWARHRSESILMGGAGEFFETLLGQDMPPREAVSGSRESDRPPVPTLWVCGSLSAATVRFVAWARHLGIAVFPLSDSGCPKPAEDPVAEGQIPGAATAALGSAGCAVLTTADERVAGSDASRRVVRELARSAARVIRDASVHHVAVEGGATATALLACLDPERLDVVWEWAPGVVTLRLRGGRLLTVKPGSYEWPEAVRSAMELNDPPSSGRLRSEAGGSRPAARRAGSLNLD